MNLIYKKATIDDIEILTKTRIEVLRAANKLSDKVDKSNAWKTAIGLQDVDGLKRDNMQQNLKITIIIVWRSDFDC